jgi:hypothetical protein
MFNKFVNLIFFLPESNTPKLLEPSPDQPVEKEEQDERDGHDDDEGRQLSVVEKVVGVEERGLAQYWTTNLEK